MGVPGLEGRSRGRSEEKQLRWIKSESGIRIKTKESLGSFNQTYSHFKLTLNVYLCQIPSGKKTDVGFRSRSPSLSHVETPSQNRTNPRRKLSEIR